MDSDRGRKIISHTISMHQHCEAGVFHTLYDIIHALGINRFGDLKLQQFYGYIIFFKI